MAGIFSRFFNNLRTVAASIAAESTLRNGSNDDDSASGNTVPVINPTTGLPMVGGIGGVDVGGNSYGSNYSYHDSTSYEHQTFNSGCGSSFDYSSSSMHGGSGFGGI